MNVCVAVVAIRQPFLLYRKVRPIKQKRSAKDAYLAEKKLIASQFRTGAKESQATLCSVHEILLIGIVWW